MNISSFNFTTYELEIRLILMTSVFKEIHQNAYWKILNAILLKYSTI